MSASPPEPGVTGSPRVAPGTTLQGAAPGGRAAGTAAAAARTTRTPVVGPAGGQAAGRDRPAAEPDAASVDEGKTPNKKRRRQIVIAVVVVLAVAAFVAKGKIFKPHYGPGHPAPNGQITALGSLTVNLSDGHLVQTKLALQLTVAAQSATIEKDEPRFDNAAITVLGRQTYPNLLSPDGRTTVKSELLTAFQQVAGKSEGAQQVSAVYFTSFILQ